jgi:hypothetical protein
MAVHELRQEAVKSEGKRPIFGLISGVVVLRCCNLLIFSVGCGVQRTSI